MGTYTPNEKFYLIDPSELVNVEQDINYNWERVDGVMRPLVEYAFTDVPGITVSSLPKQQGYKYYKTYSNAIWIGRGSGIDIYQDPNAKVENWDDTGLVFASGYASADTGEGKIRYSVFNNFVKFRGRLVAANGAELPANVTTRFMEIPAAIRPSKARYLTVWGGNSNGDFQCARIYVPPANATSWNMEFVKYGGNASSAGERYLNLGSIEYPLDG